MWHASIQLGLSLLLPRPKSTPGSFECWPRKMPCRGPAFLEGEPTFGRDRWLIVGGYPEMWSVGAWVDQIGKLLTCLAICCLYTPLPRGFSGYLPCN